MLRLLAPLAALALGAAPILAEAQGALTPQELAGKRLYQKGEGPGGAPLVAQLPTAEAALSGRAAACAGCHGADGAGRREGGVAAPSVTWASLAAAGVSAFTGRARGAYDEAALARVLQTADDPDGRALHGAMPRYALDPDRTAALIAYLKRIGTDADGDPGVSPDRLRVGSALPLTGPFAAAGRDIQAALSAYFARVNAAGGVYGRRVELVVEDSVGEPRQTEAALRRLAGRDVFALVGCFEPRGAEHSPVEPELEDLPQVGPITLAPLPGVPPPRQVFHLLASFGEQVRVLVDFAARSGQGKGTIGVVADESAYAREAQAGLADQARLLQRPLRGEYHYTTGRFAADAAYRALVARRPDWVVFLGGPAEFAAFARHLENAQWHPRLLVPALMVGRAALELPPRVAADTWLALPGLPEGTAAAGELQETLQAANAPAGNPAFQSLAFAAAKVFVAAARQVGRKLSRERFIDAAEQLWEVDTGVLPPISFGSGKRVGASGAHVVQIDPVSKRHVTVRGWMAPLTSADAAR